MSRTQAHVDFVVSLELLSNGVRVIWERLVRDILPRLVGELARRFRGVDEQLIHDGASDAILHHCEHPQLYDATCDVPLDRFLAADARRNVSNLLRAEHRLKQREKRVANKNSEKDVAHGSSAEHLFQKEESERLDQQVKAMLDVLQDPLDKELLSLRMQGVRDVRMFAEVLNIAHLLIEPQRKEVKRRKDRILRYLIRKGFALPFP